MLETIREFAAAELREAGEEASVRQRHLDHFVAFAEAVELRSRKAVTAALLDEIEVERDNIRAAVAEAAGDDDPERQLRLMTSLRFYFNVRGPGAESRGWSPNRSPAARPPRPAAGPDPDLGGHPRIERRRR